MINYEGTRFNVVLSTPVGYDKASEFEEWFKEHILVSCILVGKLFYFTGRFDLSLENVVSSIY